MGTQRHVSSLLVAGLALGVVIVGALSVRGRVQENPLRAAEALSACETAHPAAGGMVYLYVVDEQAHVVSVYANGEFAGAWTLTGHQPGEPGWYTVRSGSAQPAAGGDAYCFVIDPHLHQVHVLKNDEYLTTEDLRTEGAPVR